MNKEKEKEETQMKTKLYWEIEVKDKNGKIIESRQVEAKSWLRQFIAILRGEFGTCNSSGITSPIVTVVNESGSSRGYPYHDSTSRATYTMNLSTLGGNGDVTQGIIVGSSDTPNSLTTYALGSKISHGSGVGQLLYQAETVEDVTNPSGNDLQFRIIRAFINNSGATVTVKEIGLLVKKRDFGDAISSFLIARDVLSSPVDIPDGATLTIRYIVRITVS